VDRRTGPRAAASSIALQRADVRGSVVMRGWSRLGCLFVTGALVAAACGSSSPSGSPPTAAIGLARSAIAGRALNGVPLTSCVIHGDVPVSADADALCGTLSVPEDRANPNGRRIELRVAVIPAVLPRPAPEPFVALAGGPGDAATQFFAWLPDLYAAVHAERDIVLVDQRGTGGSHPLALPAAPDVEGLLQADADATMADWARGALGALDADIRFYTSAVAADDLDEVRAALGYDRIDLYGTSYGATLAQYYLRQHADRVRVAILDGATPLDVPVLERLGRSSQTAFDTLLARCAADPACTQAFPNLAMEWTTLRSGLERGLQVPIVDPSTGEPGIADLRMVAPGLHQALLTSGAAANVPLAIHLVSSGQWDAIGRLVPPVDTGGDGIAMADEIFCSEAWARFDPAGVAAASAGSYALDWQLAEAQQRGAICRALPAGVVPANDAAPVSATVPTLWLTADADPQDPPDNLAGVRLGADDAIVVVPAQEHVVGHLDGGPRVIAAFLDAGTARGLDTSSLTAEHMPPWTLAVP
jgi:pimeloyl-ACP methyl ester carboxylesterase